MHLKIQDIVAREKNAKKIIAVNFCLRTKCVNFKCEITKFFKK